MKTSRTALLELFEEHGAGYLSGEELSRRLGISRTAVWKQIQALKKQGYEFEAVSRLGYRLKAKPQVFAMERYVERLRTEMIGRNLIYVTETDSTQVLAGQYVGEGAAEGTAVLAELQTAGKGRMGRAWHSPRGKGLWCSVILKPALPLQEAPQLIFLCAVAVCRAIRRIAQVPAMIKWPNDLLVDGKKVCGILLESHAEAEQIRHVVAGIGIGVNLEERDYPAELLPIATSLRIAADRSIDREALLAEVMNELEELYQLLLSEGFQPIRTLWEAHNCTLGRPLTALTSTGSIEGTAEGMDRDGGLLIRQQDGSVVKLYSGDIHFAEPVEKSWRDEEN